MVAVIGIISICLLLLLLLTVLALCFLPATLDIQTEDDKTTLRLCFLGIPLYRYPEKTKLQKRPPKATKNPKTEGKGLLSLPQNTDPKTLFALPKALFQELTSLFPHTGAVLYRLRLTPPAAEDAATAALWHTAATAATAAFLELLDQNTKLTIHSRDAISVHPNFAQEKAAFSLHLTLSVSGYRALLALGSLGKRITEIQH